MLIIVTLTVISVICLVIQHFQQKSKNYVRKLSFWESLNLGFQFMQADSENTFNKLIEMNKKYERVQRISAAHVKFIFVADPNHIEKILSDYRFFEKSDEYLMLHPWVQSGLLTVGDRTKWQKRRKALAPAFHFKVLESFVQTFTEKADIFIKILDQYVECDGFNVCNHISLYTLDVLCETSMGVNVNAQAQKESIYVKSVLELGEHIVQRQKNFLARDEWIWNLSSEKKRHDELVQIIHQFTTSVIEKRKQAKKLVDQNGNLLKSNDDDLGIRKRLGLLDILLETQIDGLPLETEDIQEEVNTFMLAGHHTTTSAIEFLLYNLAKYPEIQEKVYNEVIEVFGDFSEPVTITKLNSLNYLDLVIKESLRLFPSVPLIGRYLREDVQVCETTYPAHHNVILFLYNMQRDEKYHKNPNDFIPERFLDATENIYSYIPFSAGHRSCIGQKFAQLEIKSVISKVLFKFKVELMEGFELRHAYELNLRTLGGIYLKISQRKNE